jgi:D-aminopeptidase
LPPARRRDSIRHQPPAAAGGTAGEAAGVTRETCTLALLLALAAARPRARDVGVVIGTLPTGPLNAITDVAGVRVGHATLIRDTSIRTGVTAILPHGGNLFQEKVPAAVFVGNGFGKIIGTTQIEELGEIETPILLTSTLNVPRVSDALIDYMLALPGNERDRSNRSRGRMNER